MSGDACPHCGALPAPIGERASDAIQEALRARRLPYGTVRWRGVKGGLRFTLHAPRSLDGDDVARLDTELQAAGFRLVSAYNHSAKDGKRIALTVQRG